jgi:hypothetical protein
MAIATLRDLGVPAAEAAKVRMLFRLRSIPDRLRVLRTFVGNVMECTGVNPAAPVLAASGGTWYACAGL